MKSTEDCIVKSGFPDSEGSYMSEMITFPYLLKSVLRSVARVVADSPLTHRLRPPGVFLAATLVSRVKQDRKT